jgi:hypothetical protein
MTKERIFWYKWLPGDWASDPKTRFLTLEQEGCIRRLMDIQFQSEDCSIPNDPQILSTWVGDFILDPVNQAAVFQFFPLNKKNNRANVFISSQRKNAENLSDSGKAKAEKRWKSTKRKGLRRDAAALPEQCSGNAIAIQKQCHGNADQIRSDQIRSDQKEEEADKSAPSVSSQKDSHLKNHRILRKAYKTFWADIQREHPSVRYPDPETQAGLNKHIAAAKILDQIIRIDGITEQTFMEVWRWMFDSDDREAVFWRGQSQSLEQLRKKKPGDTLNRFQKIAAAFSRVKPKVEEPTFNPDEWGI